MDAVRIVKRYQNRKLYDTEQSCYVNLGEVATMLQQGINIQVIDNETKDDITYLTFLRIIHEQELASKNTSENFAQVKNWVVQPTMRGLV